MTETVKRGTEGYAYSQQVIREQISEAIIHKVRQGRGISPRDMKNALDDNDLVSIVGDDDIMQFIVDNRKEAEGWSEKVSGRKKHNKESGARFLNEVNEILEKAEVWN